MGNCWIYLDDPHRNKYIPSTPGTSGNHSKNISSNISSSGGRSQFSTASSSPIIEELHSQQPNGQILEYIASYGKAYSHTKDPGLDIVGKCDVQIKFPGGAQWTIHNVRHIPGLVWWQLNKEGYALQVDCRTRTWKVSKRGEELFTSSLRE